MTCNKCDDICRPNLPASICPVPPAEDCPVAALTGCLGLFVVGCLLLWALLTSVLPMQPPLRAATQPVAEKPENPYSQFALFSRHWETCAQCSAPLINDKGEESAGFCEVGFRLLQADVQASKK